MLALLIACGDSSTGPDLTIGTWTVRSVQAFPTPTETRVDTTTVIVMTGTVTIERYGEIQRNPNISPISWADVEFTSSLAAVEYRAPTGDTRCSGAPLACWEALGSAPVRMLQMGQAVAEYYQESAVPRMVHVMVSLQGAAGWYDATLRWDPRRAVVYDSSASHVLELRRRD
jgi:hypothetical protein